MCMKPGNGNAELAVEMWNRSYMVQIVPYWVTFFAFELAILFGWIVTFLGGRKLVMQAIQEQSTMEEKS